MKAWREGLMKAWRGRGADQGMGIAWSRHGVGGADEGMEGGADEGMEG